MSSGRTIIVGGVAGGASCAARLRRLDENADIVLCERGPHVSFANCGLPYFVGDVITDEDQLLVTTPASLRDRFRLDVRVRSEVRAIDREQRTVQIRDAVTGRDATEPYDQLVLAPGARPVRPPLPGIDQPGIFTIRTVPDSKEVRAWIERHAARRAVVVGGGFIGLEMAENLAHRGLEVTLVELLDQVMPPLDKEMALPVQERLTDHGVALRLGEQVAGFRRTDAGLAVDTDAGSIDTDVVILAIGVRPESDLAAAAGLECNARGAIVVDAHMRTTDPSIFAVGDAVEVRHAVIDIAAMLPLAGPANRQGRVAAENIAGHETRFRGVQGTSVLGVFGLTVASTGFSEKALLASGIDDYDKIRLHAGNHVSYYPGATSIALKLLYRPSDGRVLGAQAVGESGVDKRIDVIAMAIQMQATVEDLAETELCYAPAFGAAKDPINMAGMIAGNARCGDLRVSHWEDLTADDYVLDVRPVEQFADCHTTGADNIPLTELRARLDELPRERAVHVTCNVGQTAYFATRLLVQHGFDARCISGGEQSHISLARSRRSDRSASCLDA